MTLSAQQSEYWKEIPGTTYEASSHGRIRRKSSGRLYILCESKGYLVVGLSIAWRKVMFRVSRLVAVAFLGKPRGPMVRHLNGDKKDNRPHNLAWGTAQDNATDAIRLGELRSGKDHPNSVGDRETALAIKSSYEEHMSGRSKAANGFVLSLVEEYGYTYRTTYRMCRGEHHATL